MTPRAQITRSGFGSSRWEIASRPLPTPLRPYVRGRVGYTEHSAGLVSQRQLPGPQVVVIVEFGPPIRMSDAVLRDARFPGGFAAGVSDFVTVTEHDGYQSGIQLDLTPVGARALFGVPMDELAGTTVALTDLLPPGERNLCERLGGLPDWDARFDATERVLARILERTTERSAIVGWACTRLQATAGGLDMRALARELGYSEKQVVRLFRDQIGMAPKQFARLVRFDRLVQRLRRGCDLSWRTRAHRGAVPHADRIGGPARARAARNAGLLSALREPCAVERRHTGGCPGWAERRARVAPRACRGTVTEVMDVALLTGATGFVGGALYPALARACQVRCASRDPRRARARRPDREWVELDVEREATLRPALEGVDTAYYLVHGMGADKGAGDYEEREQRSAQAFAQAAADAGVRRIVYLGGVAPSGKPSKHLRSRMRTGALLRAGKVPVVELRAGMIVGAGSESWHIVRDLSMRLPAMVLPAWLRHRSQPVAIDDVVAALVHARTIPDEACGCYALPGPQALSGQEILEHVAGLRGLRPFTLRVPFVSPRLSSYWIQWVTRADIRVARELVQGLTHDLLAHEPSYWSLMPDHALLSFDEAAQRALSHDKESLPNRTLRLERLVQSIAPKSHKPASG